MPCHEIVDGGKVIGHICQPAGTVAPAPHHRRKRWWCFQCRTRLLHTLMVWRPTGESYYGPHTWWKCPQCGEEHVLFPGREWVNEE